MTSKKKPREIELEVGYEGKLFWPPDSKKITSRETILFREVIEPDERDVEMSKLREVLNAAEEGLSQIGQDDWRYHEIAQKALTRIREIMGDEK